MQKSGSNAATTAVGQPVRVMMATNLMQRDADRCKHGCNLRTDCNFGLFGVGLSPLKVIREVQQLCSELHVVVGEDDLSLEAKRNATLLFHAFLRATLASKRVLAEYRLSEDAFDYLIGEIRTRFNEVSLMSQMIQARYVAVTMHHVLPIDFSSRLSHRLAR